MLPTKNVIVSMCGFMTLLLSACASTGPKSTQMMLVERDAVVVVEAVDVANRLVTARGADGQSFTVYVDESVKTFPTAKPGDRVRMRYKESFAVALKKHRTGTIGVEVTESTSKPESGPRPGAAASVQTKVSVRIESVDKRNNTVTFTGPRGRRTVLIVDPELQKLAKTLRPGDEVEATFTEAAALALDPVAP